MFSLTLITFFVGVAITAGKQVPFRSSHHQHSAVHRRTSQKVPLSDRFNSFMQDVRKQADHIKTTAQDKYTQFDKKLSAFSKDLVQVEGEVKGQVEKSEKLSAAIEKVGGASVKLVSGIVNGKWQDMITGALGIIGGLAALAGPVGALISSILSVISMIFGLFGGSQEAEESQEAMLKRVIDEALTKARAEELKADGEGLKKLIMSIRNSINQFRETENVSQAQANEIYNQVFTGLTFFGKLKYEINKYCDCSVPDTDNKITEIDKKKLTEARTKSNRCLEFINLYSDLSIYRLLLIIDMASLFSSVGLNTTSNNLLSLTEKEKVSDKDVIMFLFDPINNHHQRFCISQYFGAPGKYPTIQAYSDALKATPGGKNISRDVVICSKSELLGLCHKLEKKDYFSSALKGWSRGKIKSLFIADKFQVIGYSEVNHKGVPYGPFVGPTVIGLTPGAWESIKISETEKDAQNMVRICASSNFEQAYRCDQLDVFNYPDLKMIHAFNGDAFAINSVTQNKEKCVFPFKLNGHEYNHCTKSNDQHGRYWCATKVNPNNNESISIGYCLSGSDILTTKDRAKCVFPFKYKDTLFTYCTYRDEKYPWCAINGYKDSWFFGRKTEECIFDQGWEKNIASVSIPEKVQIELYTNEDFQGEKYGPFYGPNAIDKVCGQKTAKSIKVSYHNKNISEMVKICKGNSFSQHCDYLEVGDYKEPKFHGCTYSGSDDKIKSLSIPFGKKVELWTEKNFNGMLLGPYIGPVSLPFIDAGEATKDAYEIQSMKISLVNS